MKQSYSKATLGTKIEPKFKNYVRGHKFGVFIWLATGGILIIFTISLSLMSAFLPRMEHVAPTQKCPPNTYKFDSYFCAGADLSSYDQNTTDINQGLPYGLPIMYKFQPCNHDFDLGLIVKPMEAGELSYTIIYNVQASADKQKWSAVYSATKEGIINCGSSCPTIQLRTREHVSNYIKIVILKSQFSKPIKDAAVITTTRPIIQFILKIVMTFGCLALSFVAHLRLYGLIHLMPFRHKAIYYMALFAPLFYSPIALFAIYQPDPILLSTDAALTAVYLIILTNGIMTVLRKKVPSSMYQQLPADQDEKDYTASGMKRSYSMTGLTVETEKKKTKWFKRASTTKIIAGAVGVYMFSSEVLDIFGLMTGTLNVIMTVTAALVSITLLGTIVIQFVYARSSWVERTIWFALFCFVMGLFYAVLLSIELIVSSEVRKDVEVGIGTWVVMFAILAWPEKSAFSAAQPQRRLTDVAESSLLV